VLRSRSAAEWIDAAQLLAASHSDEFAKRLSRIALSKWFVSQATRNRAVKLLGFVQGEAAGEVARETLSALIARASRYVDPERTFISRRRYEVASYAIDSASQVGGEVGVAVLSTAFGAKNRELVLRAIYPMAAMKARPGVVVRCLVACAERPGAPVAFVSDALSAIGTLQEEHAAPFLIRMLSYGGESRSAARVKREAGRALGVMAQKLSVRDVEEIGELLHHTRASVRSASCYALSKLGSEARAAPVSISRALDSAPSARFSLKLLAVVTKIKRPESRQLLLSVKANPHFPSVVRRAAEKYWSDVF
jgi:HEAT repeat protein